MRLLSIYLSYSVYPPLYYSRLQFFTKQPKTTTLCTLYVVLFDKDTYKQLLADTDTI